MRTRLPVIALSGFVLLGAAGALGQAEADRRLDAAIERLRTALGPGTRIEVGARRLDPVTGRATLTDVVIHRGTARTTIPEAILDGLSESRIGRAELLRIRENGADGTVVDTTRLVLAGLALPVEGKGFSLDGLAFDALDVEGVRGTGPDLSFGLARLALRDWRQGAVGAGTLEDLAWQATGPEAHALRLGRVALEAVALPVAGQSFDPQAFRATRLALETLEVREAAQDITFSLGRMELRDWLPGRPAALVLETLRAAGPVPQLGASQLRLDRIEASGIDAPNTLDAVLGGRQVPDPFPGTPQRLLFEGLESTAEGQPLLALRRLLSEGRMDAGIATGTLLAEGFRMAVPRGQADWIGPLGYREVAGGLELRGTLPRAGGQLTLDPFRIAWDEAATLGFALQLDGVPGLPEPGTPATPDYTAYAASRLAGLVVTLRDQGLLGRVLAQQARQQRIPEARLREQWAQMALAMPLPGAPTQAQPGRRGAPPAKPAAGPDPLLPLRQAVAAFIRQPGTLEIALRPPKPLDIVGLGPIVTGDPAQAVQRLGLTATAR
jgi:hypothetical protein